MKQFFGAVTLLYFVLVVESTTTTVFYITGSNLVNADFFLNSYCGTNDIADQYGGNTYGFQWTDTSSLAPTSVTVEINHMEMCNTPDKSPTLNGVPAGDFELVGSSCSGCASGSAVNTWALTDISGYVPNGNNVFLYQSGPNFEGMRINPDWNAYATVTVTYPDSTPLTPQQLCDSWSWTTDPGYFCSADHSGFYMCLSGPFAPLDSFQPCAAGTVCACPVGVECSQGGTVSPCSQFA